MLDRALRIAGPLSAALVVVVAITLRRGDWPAQRFLIVYIAPLFAFGAAWARERLHRITGAATSARTLDALAFALGALRIAGGWGVLPYSGHMLFLTYAAVAPTSRRLRIVAVALIAMTTVFKLALWHDVRSWSLGIAGGFALAALRVLTARRNHVPQVTA